MVFRITRRFLRLLLRIIAKVTLIDFDKIPATGPGLVVTNHLGRLDAIMGFILTDRDDPIIMVADKYKAYPHWRFWIERLNGVWVNREGVDLAAVREMQRRLKAGCVGAIAPEGTRSKTEALMPGKPGAAYIAARAQVPIIPAAIMGTEDSVVKKRLKKGRRIPITVRVGDPFMLDPLPRTNREAFLHEATEEIMCRLAALLEPRYRGVYANHSRVQELLAAQEGRTPS